MLAVDWNRFQMLFLGPSLLRMQQRQRLQPRESCGVVGKEAVKQGLMTGCLQIN